MTLDPGSTSFTIPDLPESLQAPEPDSPAGKLFEAARQQFIEAGFEGSPTRAIAERAGMNAALIHYYFGTKEKLYRRVLAVEMMGVIRFQVEDRFGVLPVEDLLAGFPGRMLEWFGQHPGTARLLRHEVGAGATRLRELIGMLGPAGPLGMRARLEELARAGMAEGRLRDMPFDGLMASLVGLSYGLVLIQPLLELVVGLDLDDPENRRRQQEVLERILRHGIQEELT